MCSAIPFLRGWHKSNIKASKLLTHVSAGDWGGCFCSRCRSRSALGNWVRPLLYGSHMSQSFCMSRESRETEWSLSYILIHSFEILNRWVRGTHAMRSWTAPVDRLPGVCRWCETIYFFKIMFARRCDFKPLEWALVTSSRQDFLHRRVPMHAIYIWNLETHKLWRRERRYHPTMSLVFYALYL